MLCCSTSLLSGKLDSTSLWWLWEWVILWKFIDKKQRSNVTADKLFEIYITLEIEIFMKRNQGSICLCKVIYWILGWNSGEAKGDGFEPLFCSYKNMISVSLRYPHFLNKRYLKIIKLDCLSLFFSSIDNYLKIILRT